MSYVEVFAVDKDGDVDAAEQIAAEISPPPAPRARAAAMRDPG